MALNSGFLSEGCVCEDADDFLARFRATCSELETSKCAAPMAFPGLEHFGIDTAAARAWLAPRATES